MSITIEQIDEMRKRTNCSYEEAKELLEKNNGDIINAIVEFERKHRNGFKQKDYQRSSGFGEKLHDGVQKGFKTRFIIEKEKETILNISVNIAILVVLCTFPVFWFYPIALIAVYFMGYRIKIRKEKGEDIDINKMVNNVGGKVKTTAEKMSENEKKKNGNGGEKKDDDDYNEITVE